MRNYLSFGGGVNSVAMYLHLIEQGVEFEAVFVDHETDWPETYEYVEMFKKRYPLTVIKPEVKTVEGNIFSNLYDYYKFKKIFPFRQNRACTDRFKVRPLEKYQQPPAFVLLGFASDESHRAKLKTKKGFEYRYPLIENEIGRAECKEIIKSANLPIPIKSGCYICPFQPIWQWKELRRIHPDLFCKAQQLENGYIERRRIEGKPPLYIRDKPLETLIDVNQRMLFKENEYPPCECML